MRHDRTDGQRRAPLTVARAATARTILTHHLYQRQHPWLADLALRKLRELDEDTGPTWAVAQVQWLHGPRQLADEEGWLR